MDAYRLAILVVFCLASHSLATHVHSRWLGRWRISYDAVYISVMMLTVAWGFTLISPSRLFNLDPGIWAISLLAGPFLGLAASISDRAIVRHCIRRQFSNLTPSVRTEQRRRTQGAYRVSSIRRMPVAGESTRKRTLGLPADSHAMWQRNHEQQFNVLPLVLLAGLEELLYRGFLLHVCLMLQTSVPVMLAVTGTVVAFALSHIVFGWPHVLAKFPLGLLTTISALTFSTVLISIVAHVMFNLRTWYSWRKQSA
jgi:Type II CAAX prenyl endopeptidase Rce1-like